MTFWHLALHATLPSNYEEDTDESADEEFPVNRQIQGFPTIFGSWTPWGPILFSVDPTVQQNAIKVTKRGLSRSQVDPGWEPLDAFQGIVEVDDTVVILIADEPVEMSEEEVELQERSDQNIGSCSNKRRWRKKLEPCIYANFTTLRKKVISCATPPDAFFTFIDDEMFDKMHYETYLKSVLKEKPASISKEEIKVFIGINLMMNY